MNCSANMLHVLVVETDQGLCPIRGEVLGLFGDLGAPLRADVFPSDSAQSSVSLVRPVWTAMADAGMPARPSLRWFPVSIQTQLPSSIMSLNDTHDVNWPFPILPLCKALLLKTRTNFFEVAVIFVQLHFFLDWNFDDKQTFTRLAQQVWGGDGAGFTVAQDHIHAVHRLGQCNGCFQKIKK